MSLLIFTGSGNIASGRLLKSVRPILNAQPLTRYDDIEDLITDLRSPLRLCPIAILFPANREELARLVSLRHLLRDMQIVLILPNAQSQTISDGHALRPRFISYADGDFSDVVEVCSKMMARNVTPHLQVAQ